MVIKKNYAITVLDLEKIQDMNNIILKHAQITMQCSSYDYFDRRSIDYETAKDMTFFQIESDDEVSLDKKFKELNEELDQSITGYAIRDEDTGEMLVFLSFVAELDIKFDNIEFIEEGTFKKIDELKSLKTEFGICKGYKPNFRPMEGQQLGNTNNKPESIYLFCDSQENLMKLRDLMIEKIMEINPGLEITFTQFGGENPEFDTTFNCLDLDSSKSILEDLKNKK